MNKDINKNDLIEIVIRLMNFKGTEEEFEDLMMLLCENVPHPEVAKLIFYPEEDLTAEQIVEKALAYKPIQL